MNCGTTISFESLLALVAFKSNGRCYGIYVEFKDESSSDLPCDSSATLSIAASCISTSGDRVTMIPSYEGIGDAMDCNNAIPLESLFRASVIPAPGIGYGRHGVRILDMGGVVPAPGYDCNDAVCLPALDAPLEEMIKRCFRKDSLGRWCLCVNALGGDIDPLNCNNVVPAETMLKQTMGYYPDIDQWYINYAQ